MNGKRRISSRVFCPCYKHNDDHQIYCLGVQGCSSVHFAFKSPRERMKFMECHCNPEARSARCVLYSILFKENMDNDG